MQHRMHPSSIAPGVNEPGHVDEDEEPRGTSPRVCPSSHEKPSVEYTKLQESKLHVEGSGLLLSPEQ